MSRPTRSPEQKYWRGMNERHAVVALSTIGFYGSRATQLLKETYSDQVVISPSLGTRYMISRVPEIRMKCWNLIKM